MGRLLKFPGMKKKRRPYCAALVAAAGTSQRMKGHDKLFLYLSGQPVLARSLRALDASEAIDEIIVAARQENMLKIADLCREFQLKKPVKIIEGGSTRVQSVFHAAVNAQNDAVLLAVHDGARPLAPAALIDKTIETAYDYDAVAPAVPVIDTIKLVSDGCVEQTLDRGRLAAVQTPQVFHADLLKEALRAAIDADAEITDDCSAVERLGGQVHLIDGVRENIKITTPLDMAIAEKILELRGDII